MQATQQRPQQMVLTPNQFLNNSRCKRSRITSGSNYADGQTTTYQINQAGLGSCLWIALQGTVTVGGTITGGTFKGLPTPAPFSIIKRIRMYSNTNFYMRDLTGWGWYKWIRYRTGVDPLKGFASSFSTNSANALGVTNSAAIVAGANVAAQAYTWNLCMPMPIAYNDQAETGLLVLQQSATYYFVGIDWGTVTGGIGTTGGSNDVFLSLVGTSVTVTAAITVTIGLEWFPVIDGIGDLISLFMSVGESIVTTALSTGENLVKVPVNDFYTMMMFEIVNNGGAVAVANIQSPTFQHSGNIIDWADDYLNDLSMDYYRHGGVPPVDGIVLYDLGVRQGQLKHRDIFDAFNNRNVTDASFKFTIPSTLSLTGTQQVTAVYESLREFAQ